MASKIVQDKLRTLLDRGANREVFENDMTRIVSVQSWINFHSSTLQMCLIKGRSLAWLPVHQSPQKIELTGQVEVRIVVNVDNTFELHVLKKTVQQHSLSDRMILTPYLHTFEAGSA